MGATVPERWRRTAVSPAAASRAQIASKIRLVLRNNGGHRSRLGDVKHSQTREVCPHRAHAPPQSAYPGYTVHGHVKC